MPPTLSDLTLYFFTDEYQGGTVTIEPSMIDGDSVAYIEIGSDDEHGYAWLSRDETQSVVDALIAILEEHDEEAKRVKPLTVDDIEVGGVYVLLEDAESLTDLRHDFGYEVGQLVRVVSISAHGRLIVTNGACPHVTATPESLGRLPEL